MANYLVSKQINSFMIWYYCQQWVSLCRQLSWILLLLLSVFSVCGCLPENDVWHQFEGIISVISLLYITLPCFLIIFFWVHLHCSKGLNPICCNYLVFLWKFQLLCCMNWLCRCLKHKQMNPVKCCQWCVVSHSSTKKLEHIFWQSCSFSQGGYLQSYLCSLWISKWMVNINLWELE